MNLLAIIGSPRKGGATETLVDKAIEGACSANSHVRAKKIRLIDKKINYCTGCLVCRDSPPDLAIGRCSQQDDMEELVKELFESDLLIFGTPLRMSYVTAVMMTFMERVCWRFCKPTGSYLTIHGCPAPRSEKKRRSMTVITNSIVPPLYRMFCDSASQQVRRFAKDALNAKTVGELYAGAIERVGLEKYLDKAFNLGVKLSKE